MKERPILFSAPMVRAIFEGRKTQTRRVVKPQPQPNGGEGLHPVAPYRNPHGSWSWVLAATGHGSGGGLFDCPYGQPGDRLWVRETWQGPLIDDDLGANELPKNQYENPRYCQYKADGGPTPEFEDADGELVCRWRPSIHMPRWASRINLEITAVHIERLRNISVSDAIAEGYDGTVDNPVDPSIEWYAGLWEQINGPGSWAANPWVWVVEFKQVKGGAA